MLPVADDVTAKEGRQLNEGLIVLHGLPLLNRKAHYLSCLWRLHAHHTHACLDRLYNSAPGDGKVSEQPDVAGRDGTG